MNQNHEDVEIILIDDGSSDKSGLICDYYLKQDKRILVIHKSNGGVSSARNEGLKCATGDYITFCDADDWVDENIYVVLTKAVSKYNIDMLICQFSCDNIINVNNHKELIINQEEALKAIMMDMNCQGYIWNKMIKRSCLEDKNGKIMFDTNIYILEDQLFILKCLQNINKIYMTEQKLYHYFQNKEGAMHSEYSEKFLSVVDAREKLYYEVKKITNDDELIYIAWSQLIKDLCLAFKKLLLNRKINNKFIRLRKIKHLVKKYSSEYDLKENFSLKDKIYYILTYYLFI